MIIFARSLLFIAIAAILLVMLGFYGRTKDATVRAMGMIVLVTVVIGAFYPSLHWTIVLVALGTAIALGLASRKR